MLGLLVKLVKALNSEQSPGQIAAAISLAAIVGLTPLWSLHNILIFFLVLCLRVNLSVFLVSWPLFTLLGILIEPYAQSLGLGILQSPSLQATWESFYNTLLGRWSNFYYSGVIGSLAIALVVAIALYPISLWLIEKYRDKWLKKVQQFHFVQVLKTSRFWDMYQKYSG